VFAVPPPITPHRMDRCLSPQEVMVHYFFCNPQTPGSDISLSPLTYRLPKIDLSFQLAVVSFCFLLPLSVPVFNASSSFFLFNGFTFPSELPFPFPFLLHRVFPSPFLPAGGDDSTRLTLSFCFVCLFQNCLGMFTNLGGLRHK